MDPVSNLNKKCLDSNKKQHNITNQNRAQTAKQIVIANLLYLMICSVKENYENVNIGRRTAQCRALN